MGELDELIATAEIGEEARKFLQTDLGKCLVGMAEQEVLAAQQALEEVNPNEVEKIRELQNQAKLGRFFAQWLAELISKGEQALIEYRQAKG